ncbi:MAG: hypothetical protein HY010_15995 [Acidobacteria bacterium]|nr:hypothetical protein [Acidobacteriota bacterium]
MKKIALYLCLLTLCSVTLLAQTRGTRIVHTKEKSGIHVPAQEAPVGLTKIYNNLGKKTDAYYDQSGWFIGGSYRVSIAIPFTPKLDSHVSQVQAAIQYAGFGANQVDLSVWSDNNGVPSGRLAGPVTVTNLPVTGTCCTLAVANFPPFAVTAGTKYWLVAGVPLNGPGSDFQGLWAFVPKIVPFAESLQALNDSWTAMSANDLPAGAVLGTIP